MPRKTNDAYPDDTDTDGGLAPAVSEHQWRALRELRARGARFPAPASWGQAEQILRQWRRSAPRAEPDDAA